MDAKADEKRKRLEEALAHGITMVHLDARQPGVIVPAQFRDDFHLRLNVSFRFDPPDLSLSSWGVRETLSFRGSRFTVGIPWQAIFAITSQVRADAAWLFPEDMPAELLANAAHTFGLDPEATERLLEKGRSVAKKAAAERPAPTGDPTFKPRVVEGAADAKTEEKPEPGRRGHLRVVK